MEIVRTQREINEQLDLAHKYSEEGSKYFGLSYEEGLIAMYDWLVGNTDDLPMEEE